MITDFVQIRPGDGAEPSERTEVYLLYDDDALYVGVRMYDSEPERIAAPTVRHGQGLGADDRLVVILDPFNTRRTGYRFETNANGVRHDALYEKTCEWGAIDGPKILVSECVRCDDCERLYDDEDRCPHWLIQKRAAARADS